MKALKAVYNFIVGDMIILVGVLAAMVLLGIIAFVPALAPLRFLIGIILVVTVLTVLTATLYREARGQRIT